MKNQKLKIKNSSQRKLKIFFMSFVSLCLGSLFFSTLFAQIIPIADAIVDADSNGIPDRRGQFVTITGVVTAPTGVFSRTQTDIYVQDNTAGVNVFSFIYQPVALADSVVVSGVVYFYRGKTEIYNANIIIVANNCRLPDPKPLTCAMMNREPYEGSLVKLSGVFTNAFILAGDQNYTLFDNTGSCLMRIDIDTDIAGLIVSQDTFTVIGIKSQYTTDTFPPVNKGYQFLPRYRTDFSQSLSSSLPLLTIAEVQRPGSDGYSSVYDGQYVKVQGWITGPSYIFTSGSSKSLYIQDATGGVNVYAPSFVAATSKWLDSVGTNWECIGKVTEYNGLTEIASGFMTLLDSSRYPVPIEILPFNTPVTEGLESKLIQVTGSVVSSPASAGGGMNFDIKNGTPAITIRVMNNAGIPINWIEKGKRVRVIGIVGQYTSTAPFSTGYQLMPRFAYELVDMTDTTPASLTMRIDTIYPNPFSPTDPEPLKQVTRIQINSPADYKLYLEIFDMKGRLVKSLLTNCQGGFYGPDQLIWDGRDDKQEPCPIGIYVLNLKGITPDGKNVFVRKPIVIATKLK